jgi:hypothetical protein
MSPAEILALAKASGVIIRPDGGELEIIADRSPDPDLLDAIAGCKAEILTRLRAERGRINHWIANWIIDWPPGFCLHCRKPVIAGQAWIAVSSGDLMARFHQACHGEWLTEHEALARRALRLDP